MKTDLFRFVAKRSIQRMPAEIQGQQLIPLFAPGTTPEDNHALPAASNAQLVADFFNENPDAGDLKDLKLSTPLVQIDQLLLKCGNNVKPQDIADLVKKATNQRLRDFVKTEIFKTELQKISRLLFALITNSKGREAFRDLLLRARYLFEVILQLAALDTGTAAPQALPTSPDYVHNLVTQGIILLPPLQDVPGTALSRQPSIGDLQIVREEWQSYEMGEIAHIENAMKGESRERVHKLSSTREELLLIETEQEREETRDLQTTERYELQSEISRAIQEDTKMDIGSSITASYGVIKEATATFDYATSTSKEESAKQSSSYAKELTERSSARVREKVREQQSVRTVVTVEETNKHVIDNSKSDKHVTGIYRWVNKKYKAQVFNYGKRMMLEFLVPEPAAFLKKTLEGKYVPTIPDYIENRKPIPMDADLHPGAIDRINYVALAKKHGVQLEAPPAEVITVSKAFHLDKEEYMKDRIRDFSSENNIAIGADYEGRRAWGDYLVWTQMKEGGGLFSVAVANALFHKEVTGDGDAEGEIPVMDLPNVQTGNVPVIFRADQLYGYAFNLVVECRLRKEPFEKWQMSTYMKIKEHVDKLQLAYEQDKTAFLESLQLQKAVAMQGKNPDSNRLTERTELKKSVIAMLQKHYFDQAPFDQQAVDANGKIKFDVARLERDHIQWFEQAFEWPNISYGFYPYFYNDPSSWQNSLTAEDANDPQFNAFLQAGAARVVVPVRPNFERAMAFYLATGIIWQGSQVPQVDDPLYVSLVQEIQEQQTADQEGTPVGEPWEYTLPTNLVILQKDGELPRA